VLLLSRVSHVIVRVVDRYLPEPFVFAIIMTAGTIMLVLMTTTADPIEVFAAWGGGLSMLLAFTTQMCLMVLFAYTLAHIGPVPRLLARLASIPGSAKSAYSFATVFAGLVALVAWPLGVILGGLMARAIGDSLRERGIRVHYPLLGGAAFGGFVIWHMGYSGSAPLLTATPGNPLEQQLGLLIPVSETIFTTWNLSIAAVTLATVAVVATMMHPVNESEIEECPPDNQENWTTVEQGSGNGRPEGPARTIETSRLPTLLVGLMLSAYIVYWLLTRGLLLDLNIVNWTFLAAGLLLTRSSSEYASVMLDGGRAVVPILLQYPMYAGIMGIMLKTGLVSVLASWFLTIASDDTLPFLAFLSGGFINFFIPSGGAQWAVQGPAFIEAAKTLGTDLPLVVMGVAYGDQWTNIIHPFVVIPLLIMTGLKARQVLAYSFILFLAAGVTLGGGLLLLGGTLM